MNGQGHSRCLRVVGVLVYFPVPCWSFGLLLRHAICSIESVSNEIVRSIRGTARVKELLNLGSAKASSVPFLCVLFCITPCSSHESLLVADVSELEGLDKTMQF